VGSRRLTGGIAAVSITLVTTLVACSGSPEDEPGRTPDSGALLSAINTQLDLRPGHENVRAVLVLVDGKPVVERYDDVPAARPWDIGWGTVAVVATLVGIAIDGGRIPGLDATLRQLLPDHVDDMSPVVAATTLREVLTMDGGFHGTQADDPVAGYMRAPDPVGLILRAARPTSPARFDYSSQGAHLLSAILAKATGMSVLDYARAKLFDPLAIDTTSPDFAWPADSTGLNLGWTGLKLSPGDLARLGRLYADGGTWKGRRLLSSSWVHESTRVQEKNVAHPSDNFSGYGGYGYGWWLIESDHEPAFFVADLTGQLLEVLPSHDLVVVVASEVVPGSPGVTPDALTFLVNDAIGPGVRK
jgi:CubicO group peptidase (beta-lactamase class C family)